MADGLGVLVEAGWYDSGTTWDIAATGVETATGHLPLVSESLTKDYLYVQSKALTGEVSAKAPEQADLRVNGDIQVEGDYVYGHQLLEYALGALTGTTYNTADALQFFGLVFDKGVERWCAPSCAVNSLTISGAADSEDPVMFGYNLTASRLNRAATAIASLTKTGPERIIFNDLVVRIADKADALAAGDVREVSSFELTLNNALQNDMLATGSGQGFALEPKRNGFRTGQLQVTLPRYVANTFQGWKDSHTPLQADLIFTGTAATMTIQVSTMYLTSGADVNVAGPDVIPVECTFDIVGGANTNFTYDDMLAIGVA